MFPNEEILMFRFPKSLTQVDPLFLLGNYMEMVDKIMGESNGELFIGSVRGQLVAKVTVVGSRGTPTLISKPKRISKKRKKVKPSPTAETTLSVTFKDHPSPTMQTLIEIYCY